VDSHIDGSTVTSHWVTARPADQVCFSIGEVDEFKINDPRIPPVTVHTNGEAHRQLDKFFLALRDQLGASDAFVSRFLSERSPEQDVGADVANSLAFFTRIYGPPLFDRYYAAEIPFDYGQAFPGLIYLPVWTFQAMSDSGYDEILRAHEMAHQWWGIGIEPASYRDRWLAEGFAEFSGLWYMQIVLGDNEKFFKHLKHWRRELRGRRNDAPPIGIGWRAEQQLLHRIGNPRHESQHSCAGGVEHRKAAATGMPRGLMMYRSCQCRLCRRTRRHATWIAHVHRLHGSRPDRTFLITCVINHEMVARLHHPQILQRHRIRDPIPDSRLLFFQVRKGIYGGLSFQ